MSKQELHLKYRPSKLEEVIGQEAAVKALLKLVRKKRVPHANLIHGPSGTGKTTIARILAHCIGCDDVDLEEINMAHFRGIDKAKEIASVVGLMPMGGTAKAWILDECFAGFTLVATPSKQVRIDEIKEGDKVVNVQGEVTVEHVFHNKVTLDRVVKVTLTNGKEIFCSCDHLFLTERGWVKARELKAQYILTADCNTMNIAHSIRSDRHEENSMSMVRCGIRSEECSQMLFAELRAKTTLFADARQSRYQILPLLRRRIQSQTGQICPQATILFNQLFKEIYLHTARISEEVLYQTASRKSESSPFRVLQDAIGQATAFSDFRTHDKEQSITRSCHYREDQANERKEWYSAYLDWQERGQWSIYETANQNLEAFRQSEKRMGAGVVSIHTELVSVEVSHTDELQNRCWQRSVENSLGDRWERTQCKEAAVERREENMVPGKVRVDSVKVYKRGSNEEAFSSVVTDKERNQGYVIFYDLQISKHPSYIAEGCIVHNCHRLTADAQECLLKPLEEPPLHAYFFLCTTAPNKLITALKSRCTHTVLTSLSDMQVKAVLDKVCYEEGITLSEEVLDALITAAAGSARNALVNLAKISDLKDDEQLEAISAPAIERQAFDLVKQLLYSKADWKKLVASVTEDSLSDLERFRYFVLACATTEIKKGNKNAGRAFAVIQAFRDPWYECKEAGLWAACWEVLQPRG